MIDFYYILPMPNATSELFNWDYDVLREVWFYYVLILVFVIIVSKILFYFFSYPTKNALSRFWVMCLVESILTTLFGFILIYNYYMDLASQSGFVSFLQFLVLLVYFLLDFIIVSLLIVAIFSFLGYILAKLNFNTRIRALRRYPFKFVK